MREQFFANNVERSRTPEVGREKPIIVIFNVALGGGGDIAATRAFTHALAQETKEPVVIQVRRFEDEKRIRAAFAPEEQRSIGLLDRSLQAHTDITVTCPLTVDETQFRLGEAKRNYYVSEYDPSSFSRFHIPKVLTEQGHVVRKGREHILCRAGFHSKALGIHIDPDVLTTSMPTTPELTTILERASQLDSRGERFNKAPFQYQGEPFVLLYNHVNSNQTKDFFRNIFVMCEQKKEELLMVVSGKGPTFLAHEHYGNERGKRVRIIAQDGFSRNDFLKLMKAARLSLVTGDMSVSEAVALETPLFYDAPPWKRGREGVWSSYIDRATTLFDSDDEIRRFLFLMGFDLEVINNAQIHEVRHAFIAQLHHQLSFTLMEQSLADQTNSLHGLLFNKEDRSLVAKYHQRLREQHNFARNFADRFLRNTHR